MPLPKVRAVTAALHSSPFKATDVTGWLNWDDVDFAGPFFHSCSPEEAKRILSDAEARPRSEIQYRKQIDADGNDVVDTFLGLWATLNDYVDGFDFGPVLFTWGTSALEGKRFICIDRTGTKSRIDLVEFWEEMKPSWAQLAPSDLFDVDGRSVSHRTANRNYSFVLRRPLAVRPGATTVRGVAHRFQTSEAYGRKLAAELGAEALVAWLSTSPEYERLAAMYPDLVGTSVRMPIPDLGDSAFIEEVLSLE